jgi:thioredoxin-related protein
MAATRGHGAAGALLALAVLMGCVCAQAAEPSPHAIELPPVFKETFLDIRADARDAARQGKRLMLYFGQDGCPYCRRLLQDNLRQKDIAERVEKHLYPIALNLWGDREVTWIDGTTVAEKALAARLGVQFTPTLIFFDESARVVARINGYYPPHRFRAAIDYVGGRMENRVTFAEYMVTAVKEPARGQLNDQPFFLPPPLNLARKANAKPLALFVEQVSCQACDEMHGGPLQAAETRALLRHFDAARIDLFGKASVIGPDGKRAVEAELGRALQIAYTPSVVLFDASAREVLRIEGYVRALHLQSALDYVASGAYRTQPSFQRYLRERTERMRSEGAEVRLW